MKIRIIIYSFLALYFSSCSNDKNLIKYVDPFIGSDAHGHVFVGANVPFGGVQVGPANFQRAGIGLHLIIIQIVLLRGLDT